MLAFHVQGKISSVLYKIRIRNTSCHTSESNESIIFQGKWNNVRKKEHGYSSCTAHTLYYCLFTLEILKEMNNDKLLSFSGIQ